MWKSGYTANYWRSTRDGLRNRFGNRRASAVPRERVERGRRTATCRWSFKAAIPLLSTFAKEQSSLVLPYHTIMMFLRCSHIVTWSKKVIRSFSAWILHRLIQKKETSDFCHEPNISKHIQRGNNCARWIRSSTHYFLTLNKLLLIYNWWRRSETCVLYKFGTLASRDDVLYSNKFFTVSFKRRASVISVIKVIMNLILWYSSSI